MPSSKAERQQKKRERRRERKEVAALGTVGYIPIDPDFNKRGPITKWIEECAAVLRKTKRSAITISEWSMPDGRVKTGSSKAPVLIVAFASEELLERALCPISILDFKTKVLRFTGDRRPFVYIVGFGICGHDPGKIKEAFERQANAKMMGWGWSCDGGAEISLLFQTKRLLSQNISKIKVGRVKLSCVFAPDKEYCCCGGKHDCFLIGSKCKKFMRKEAY